MSWKVSSFFYSIVQILLINMYGIQFLASIPEENKENSIKFNILNELSQVLNLNFPNI